MELKYIRTDKNGTKYYHDWTCPRCGGAGEADKWAYTGRICYACGGTGKRAKPLVVKEYTDEYAAKLEARRIAKQKKWEEDHADEIAKEKAEAEAREAEARKRYNEIECRYYGCGLDGIGYILTGKTYPIKDQIKDLGGKWLCGVWICPTKVEAKGVFAKQINLFDRVNESGRIYDSADLIFDAMNA